MIVGLLSLDLHLPGCDTLKEKRHRLKGVIERVRTKFNVSISEVGHQDLHQSAGIAVAMVNAERALIEKVFEKVEGFFANGNGLEITSQSIEWF
ncbi:MAG TPA: DUF503 domain-containing protein [bacterium]|jgi:hypothetical protein